MTWVQEQSVALVVFPADPTPTATGATITFPAAPSEGSELICYAIARPANASTSTNVLSMAGWTKIRQQDTTSHSIAIFHKTAGASEPTAHTLTATMTGDTNMSCGLRMIEVSGPAFGDVVIDEHSNSAGASVSNWSDSFTTPSADPHFVAAIFTIRQSDFYDLNWKAGEAPANTFFVLETSNWLAQAGWEEYTAATTDTWGVVVSGSSAQAADVIVGWEQAPVGPTPPTYVATNTEGGTDLSSFPIAKPTGTVEGDLMVAYVGSYDTWKGLPSAPAGWTLVGHVGDPNYGLFDGATGSVWWKIAGPSEPASYTFSNSGSRYVHAAMVTLRPNAGEQWPTNPIQTWAQWGHILDGSPMQQPGVTTTTPATAVGFASGYDAFTPGNNTVPNWTRTGTADANWLGVFIRELATADTYANESHSESESGTRGSLATTWAIYTETVGGGTIVDGTESASTSASDTAAITASVTISGTESASLSASDTAGIVATTQVAATESASTSASDITDLVASSGASTIDATESTSLSVSDVANVLDGTVITAENALAGEANTANYQITGAGSLLNQGFARAMSVNDGETIDFAVDGDSTAIDIYRIGHYGGNNWRLITSIVNAATAQVNEAIIANSDGATECSSWSNTASWTVPVSHPSGLHVAVVRNAADTAPESWIPFVVRNDSRPADITVCLSTSTWAMAYNYSAGPSGGYLGGKNLYGSGIGVGTITDRSTAVSADRPIVSRQDVVNHWDNYESALIDWLEQNGFDVKYVANHDLERDPTSFNTSSIFISAGHDEYWSAGMRTAVENFRYAGGHCIFLSANEIFWKVRWADNFRTMWCYKDTMPGPGAHVAGDPLDPVEWTGTWRDTRWANREPENLLTGTTFRMNGISYRTASISSATHGSSPFWRNTTMATGTDLVIAESIGFEADSIDIPDSRIRATLASTSINIDGSYADDNGQNYSGNGTLNWGITIHQINPTDGYVISFASMAWIWTLSDYHRLGSAVSTNVAKQAMVNLLYDLGAPAASLGVALTEPTPVAMSTYNLQAPPASPGVWDGPDPTEVSDTGGYELGTEFTATAGAAISGVRIWNPGNDTVTGRVIRLWNAGGEVVDGTFPYNIPDQLNAGWNDFTFPATYTFSAGTYILSAAFGGQGVNGYGSTSFNSYSDGGIALTAGLYSTSIATRPTNNFNSFYGVDPLIGSVPAIPTDPTLVVATQGNAQAGVTWADSIADPIPTWDVEIAPSPYAVWSPVATDVAQGVQTATATGLSNGTTYKFRVRGQNINGDSNWVESNEVTPVALSNVEFRGIESTPYAARTNTSVNRPTGVIDGDLLLAMILTGLDPEAPDPTPPAGWQLAAGPTEGLVGGFNVEMRVYWKIASNEPVSWTWTHANCNSQLVVAAYWNVDQTTPFDTTATTNGGAGTTSTALGLTTVTDGAMIVFVEHDWGNLTAGSSPPVGTTPTFTERYDVSIAYWADGVMATAGATGDKTITNNNTDGGWGAILLALRPAAADAIIDGAESASTSVSDTADIALGSITDYVVQYRTSDTGSGPGEWQTFADGVNTATGATVTGLTPSISYDFRVAAVNGVGTGTWSNITTVTAPGGTAVTGTESSSLSASDTANVIPTTDANGIEPSSVSASDSATIIASANVSSTEVASTSASDAATITASAIVDGVDSVSVSTSDTVNIAPTAGISAVESASLTASETANITSVAGISGTESSSTTASDAVDIVASTSVDGVGSASISASDIAGINAATSVSGVESSSVSISEIANISSSAGISATETSSLSISDTADTDASTAVDSTESASASASDSATTTASANVTSTEAASISASDVAAIVATANVDGSGTSSNTASDSATLVASANIEAESYSVTSSDSASLVASANITPVEPSSITTSDTAQLSSTGAIDPLKTESITSSDIAGINAATSVSGVDSASISTSDTPNILASTSVDASESASVSTSEVANISSSAGISAIESSSSTASDAADISPATLVTATQGNSVSVSDSGTVTASTNVAGVDSASTSAADISTVNASVTISGVDAASISTSDPVSINSTGAIDAVESSSVTNSDIAGIVTAAIIGSSVGSSISTSDEANVAASTEVSSTESTSSSASDTGLILAQTLINATAGISDSSSDTNTIVASATIVGSAAISIPVSDTGTISASTAVDPVESSSASTSNTANVTPIIGVAGTETSSTTSSDSAQLVASATIGSGGATSSCESAVVDIVASTAVDLSATVSTSVSDIASFFLLPKNIYLSDKNFIRFKSGDKLIKEIRLGNKILWQDPTLITF